jgi:hypothetical protein
MKDPTRPVEGAWGTRRDLSPGPVGAWSASTTSVRIERVARGSQESYTSVNRCGISSHGGGLRDPMHSRSSLQVA